MEKEELDKVTEPSLWRGDIAMTDLEVEADLACRQKRCGPDDGMNTSRHASTSVCGWAVVWETKDFGLGFPSWHAHLFEEGACEQIKEEVWVEPLKAHLKEENLGHVDY